MENEKIIVIYPMDLRGGGLIQCFDVYFTNQRLVTNYLESRLYSRYWGNGCILFGYYLLDSTIIAPLTRHKVKITTENPSQILKVDKRNFSWSFRDDIKSIQFKTKTGVVGPPHIEIELMDGKRNVLFHKRENRNELIKLFQQLAPEKVKVE